MRHQRLDALGHVVELARQQAQLVFRLRVSTADAGGEVARRHALRRLLQGGGRLGDAARHPPADHHDRQQGQHDLHPHQQVQPGVGRARAAQRHHLPRHTVAARHLLPHQQHLRHRPQHDAVAGQQLRQVALQSGIQRVIEQVDAALVQAHLEVLLAPGQLGKVGQALAAALDVGLVGGLGQDRPVQLAAVSAPRQVLRHPYADQHGRHVGQAEPEQQAAVEGTQGCGSGLRLGRCWCRPERRSGRTSSVAEPQRFRRRAGPPAGSRRRARPRSRARQPKPRTVCGAGG